VDECAKEIEAHEKWLTTRLKAAAPQALLVAEQSRPRAEPLEVCFSCLPFDRLGALRRVWFRFGCSWLWDGKPKPRRGTCLQMLSS
jgi:hypothetical protein